MRPSRPGRKRPGRPWRRHKPGWPRLNPRPGWSRRWRCRKTNRGWTRCAERPDLPLEIVRESGLDDVYGRGQHHTEAQADKEQPGGEVPGKYERSNEHADRHEDEVLVGGQNAEYDPVRSCGGPQ